MISDNKMIESNNFFGGVRIAIIIPWFGKLPSYYEAWKKTVLANNSIDFYLFTDCNVDSEGNIIVKKISFDEFRNKFKQNLPFEMICNTSYKLRVFAPAIGKAVGAFFAH